MGKVQDTTSSMNRRRNHNSSPQIALIIPAQQAPGSGSFPTKVKAVSSWLSASAAGSTEQRTSALIKALKHSNRLQNTPAERLKILDILLAELQQILPNLRSQFADSDFPRDPSADVAYSQTTELLLEISYGYKISLIDALLGRGVLTQKVRVHTIYRAIKAIGDCGLHHSQGYRRWPAKSWRDLNTLLLLAEHEKAHEMLINTGSAQNYPETIQGLYIAYALLNSSHTRHLQSREIDGLFATLCAAAANFRLTRSKNHSNAGQFLSVALNSSIAPTPDHFCNYSNNAKVRYLSLEPLMNLLSSDSSRNKQPDSLTGLQQDKLNQIWLQNSKRKSARAIRNSALFAQPGLEKITTALCDIPNPQSFSQLFSIPWVLRNESALGVALRAPAKQDLSVNIGEPIAFGASQAGSRFQQCQVAVIRWLNVEEDKPLELGAETIGLCVECVTVTARNPLQDESSVNALIGIDSGSTATQTLLLVPRQRYKSGESVTLSVGSSSRYRNCIIALGALIDQRATFDCFAIGNTPLI